MRYGSGHRFACRYIRNSLDRKAPKRRGQNTQRKKITLWKNSQQKS